MRSLLLAAALLAQAAPPRPMIVLVSGEFEYESKTTLPEFKRFLEARYDVSCVTLERREGQDLPGLEALEKADLAILYVRRMTLPPDQLGRIRKYVDSGRPLVALRTSSHAFENWKEFDRDVLGGNYRGHHGAKLVATARIDPKAAGHPILKGVDATFETGGSLYRTSPLAPAATPLLIGSVEGQPPEPLAWTNDIKGARVFYTSLGHPKDFQAGPFKQLLVNAIGWALGRDLTARGPRGLTPAEAMARMKLAPGFQVSLFAGEPDVLQPLAMNWDDRGRMWVIEYLQYPHPAGLKALEWDRYFRTKYDRVPEPPPHGPRGADRIKILEDSDGDGRADKVKVFAEGLNLATGVAVGHGGVYVCQTPYLLFYPDRDADDVPDGPPEVLVKGFGMEDAHAVVNSLMWGPDGWLYGAQGSTVTANIGKHSFQQGVWRFHPRTKEFELFAEGGGNTWSFDFDRDGHLLCGTNWGQFTMLHLVQGGYYVKGFEKHGPLSNPYAFGYFPHVPHAGFKGGHVTIGGLVYQADRFPASFRGKTIAANLLSNAVYWFDVERSGSSFASSHGGDLLLAHDDWFRPVDLTQGPDGAVYVADWYDIRATHNNTREDTWDKSTGRIYRIEPEGGRRAEKFHLSKLSSPELVDLFRHPNEWFHREARRILAERRDAAILPALRARVLEERSEHLALECLWALYVSGGFDEPLGRKLLEHPAAPVRMWTVRFLGDLRRLQRGETQIALAELAKKEPSADVRSQLAASLRRLPANQMLPLLTELIKRDEDAKDPQLPLLLWWAIEFHTPEYREALARLLGATKSELVRTQLLERMARRLASTGIDADLHALVSLLPAAPEETLSGIDLALAGRRLEKPPASLLKAIDALMRKSPRSSLNAVKVAARLGDKRSQDRLFTIALDGGQPAPDRLAAIPVIAQIGGPEAQAALLGLLLRKETDAVLAEVLRSLGGFGDAAVADALLGRMPTLSAPLRDRALDMLAGRKEWARKLIEAQGAEFRKQPLALVQKMHLLNDPDLNELIEKSWGRVQVSDKAGKIRELAGVVGPITHLRLPGRIYDLEAGKAAYVKRCAPCHALFGEGGKTGPDLTSADRRNIDVLMQNIVDPSAAIRKEFANFIVDMKDGRILNGVIVEATPEAVTLADAQAQKHALARADIREIRESQLSLMPEGLLDDLDKKALVDFFAYLAGTVGKCEDDAQDQGALPGTQKLSATGDLAAEMVAGIDRYLTRELAASAAPRQPLWKPDFSDLDRYAKSVQPNRERFRRIIGAVDPRRPVTALEYVAATDSPSLVGQGKGYAIHAVRWPVFEGVHGEGLLLQPDGRPVARIVAIPDADLTPEKIAGLVPGTPDELMYAKRLAENGCQVIVPVLIDRQDAWSGHPQVRFTNQPHREWIYRAAYQMGRHLIGYEVQKVLAAVDWLEKRAGPEEVPLGVAGWGEGGLLAFASAAADGRLDCLVSGHFQEREGVWQEPIYRNVWSLLREFGDAELAGLVAPRALVVEASEGPQVEGPPPARQGRSGAAPGRLVTPPAESVRREYARAQALYARAGIADRIALVEPVRKLPGIGEDALLRFLKLMDKRFVSRPPGPPARDARVNFDPAARLKRQFDELNEHTQRVFRASEGVREKFWARADKASAEKFAETSKAYRELLWDEVIGRLPALTVPPFARTRQAYDEPAWRGYEVMLDVYPDVFASGVLLVPRDLKPGERRPVVVCQHGLEGRPEDTITRDEKARGFGPYQAYASRLADRGFVVYAPQNPYIGQDRFRVLQRKANPLKLSLFSFIVRQHERTLEWLASLPFVDPARIGFYGLSYGGKTAVRVPTILADRYALSICSADYNEWVLKNVSITHRYSYMFTGEYEMFEFDLGNTFNYAELSALMVPRPFMVERGHRDGVAPSEWVAYEFAKVRRLYDQLGIGPQAEIEFFNGPHAINGKGTFDFLHRHLAWPAPK